MTDMEGSEAGYVDPITDCPHVGSNVKALTAGDLAKLKTAVRAHKCDSCDSTTETWLCLQCHASGCGRFASAHMLKHNQETKHAIACGLDDLSFWCYSCEAYIAYQAWPVVYNAYAQIHNVKFGKLPRGGGGAIAAEDAAPRELSGPDTAHKKAEDYKEYVDSKEVFDEKVDTFVKWLREAKHATAFTGAGISTSAGVPDFRSGSDTIVETGAGVWTREAEKRQSGVVKGEAKASKYTTTSKAVPTPTHMTLVELQRRGMLKYLVSQNTDGLHRRSGFPPQALSELHGNSNLESCQKCGKEYMRDFPILSGREGVHDHLTGRTCVAPGCGGALQDTIINFNENLPQDPLQFGFGHAFLSDLCLVLGSSLRVAPALHIPGFVGKNKRLVICNLQATPLDKIAALRVNAKCDDFMRAVMKKLGIAIPEFRLVRRARISSAPKTGAGEQGGLKIAVAGEDVDGTPASVFKQFKVEQVDAKAAAAVAAAAAKFDTAVNVTLRFYGHYNEPDLTIRHEMPSGQAHSVLYELTYNPMTGKWADPVAIPESQSAAAAGDAKVADKGDGKAAEAKKEAAGAAASASASAAASSKRDFAALVKQVRESGFDVKRAREILQSFGSDLGEAFEHIFGGGDG